MPSVGAGKTASMDTMFRIAPPRPCSAMIRCASIAANSGVRTLTAYITSNASRVVPDSGPAAPGTSAIPPALLTSTSSPPNACAAAFTISTALAVSAMSTTWTEALRPSDLISAATSSSSERLRAEIATSAPCRANARAMARPMPRPPPVTSAFLLLKENIALPPSVLMEAHASLRSMSERVSTLIIGGGIAGTALAHYLAEEGEKGILLVEADELGSGSTGGSFGGVRQQFSTPLEIELSRRGLDFWRSAERVFDSPVPWHENGYLFMSGKPDIVSKLAEAAELQRSMGLAD